PLGGRKKASQHFHGGGLSAAVRAQKTEDLAALDRQRDVVNGGEVAAAASQTVGFGGNVGLARRTRRNRRLRMTPGLFLWQQRNETFLQIFSARSLHQLRGRSRRQHASRVHGDDPVPLLRLVHVGGGNDDAHAGAPFANIINERPELLSG